MGVFQGVHQKSRRDIEWHKARVPEKLLSWVERYHAWMRLIRVTHIQCLRVRANSAKLLLREP